MIGENDILSFNYLKKQAFYGSHAGMRYCLRRAERGEDDQKKTVLEAVVWPEPLNLAHTAPELIEQEDFSFSTEGREDAIAWLNGRYEAGADRWESRKGKL